MLQYDHIAIGLSDAAPLLRVLTKDMGGTVLGGGVPPGSGFRVIQVHLGEPESPGMTVELLEPHLPEANDFLQRFVERHGDGPHHVTFKTDDIGRELERLKALGIDPVGINFANPDWQEMFIHPKMAHGIVVQIAQSAYGLYTPSAMVTERRAQGQKVFEDRNWWGEITRGSNPVWLRRVVLGSPEPEKTTEFYATVLLGETCEPGRICWTGGEILVEESPSFGLQRLELEGDHLSIEMAGTVLASLTISDSVAVLSAWSRTMLSTWRLADLRHPDLAVRKVEEEWLRDVSFCSSLELTIWLRSIVGAGS